MNLPDPLLNELRARTGAATKTTAVVIAINEYIERRRALELGTRLFGKVRFVRDPVALRHSSSAADRARGSRR